MFRIIPNSMAPCIAPTVSREMAGENRENPDFATSSVGLGAWRRWAVSPEEYTVVSDKFR